MDNRFAVVLLCEQDGGNTYLELIPPILSAAEVRDILQIAEYLLGTEHYNRGTWRHQQSGCSTRRSSRECKT